MTTQISRPIQRNASLIALFALLGLHLTACAPEEGDQPFELAESHDLSGDLTGEEIELTDLESEIRGGRRARPSRAPSSPRPEPLAPQTPNESESEPEVDSESELEPEVDSEPDPEPEPEPEVDSEPEFEPELEPEPEPELSYEHSSVSDTLELPATPHSYRALNLPPQFAAEAARADNTPAGQEIDDDQATLGRVLFYDTLLSRNESTSCASCHQQELGFSDNLVFSEGFDGELTGRNSMPVINVRYYESGAMFWDERAETLEHQVLMPIQDEIEMGLDLDSLTQRLRETSYYPTLFTLAFGDAEITTDRIARALAQFSRSIISYSSPYDLALAQSGGDPRPPFAQFSAQENRGKQLFFAPPQAGGAGCAGCHNAQGGAPRPGQMPAASIFFMNGALNNGLTDGRGSDEDLGLGAVTGRAADNGKFKSPTLRQIELTGPYMHDGSLETLRDVIDHYDRGVEPHPNLDPRLRQGPNGPPRILGLSEADKVALEAFLITLTDDSISTDERFSDPFVQ